MPGKAAARTLRFDRDTLRTHRLYLRSHTNPDDYLYIDPVGNVQRAGKVVGRMHDHAELFLAQGRVTLYVDGSRITNPSSDWDVFWEAAEETAPELASALYPQVDVADGFMRFDLVSGPCTAATGSIALAQHGGGMARSESEVHSYDFQRAVNPFTVRGSGGASLTYGGDDWAEYAAEARFYFGLPKTDFVVDGNTLPTGTNLLVVQGPEAGLQVGFGWLGSERRFCLVQRHGGAPWEVLATYGGSRPPLTNWVRIGVTVADGCRLEGWLDQVRVLSTTLTERVSGPCQILVGEDLAEFDDVRICSLPVPAPAPEPLLAVSRAFAGKEHKNKADPEQFGQWAEGNDTFVHFMDRVDGQLGAGIRTRQPLIGAWEYRSQTYDERLGEIPAGRYCFLVTEADIGNQGTGGGKTLAQFTARRDAQGWQLELPGWGDDRRPGLQLRVRRTPAGDLDAWLGGAWVSLGLTAPGNVRLGVLRLRSEDGVLVVPRPEHHRIFCQHLHNEFFEEAPADWVWLDGAFRMDARWACQNQWNFLACGSTAVPMIVSKRRFAGDQFHEYFISQRPVMPWDAGDASFRYDPAADRENKFQTLIANEGWYVRRDLNVSFCGNGRDPLSGYAVLFGANDNRETCLVRQGQVVAQTTDPSFLFPTQPGFGVVHYFWRRIAVWKAGPRVRVWIDDRPVFDYTDPAPLAGGHLAFWSVRNGFAVTKASSMAEETGWEPAVLSVPPVAPATHGWHPLHTDALRVAGENERTTTFERTTGTGFGAVRYESQPPWILAGKPVLELPLEVPPNVALNLHVQTSVGSFLIPVTAPITGMKALLTPDFEKGECFRLPTLEENAVRQLFLIEGSTYADGLLRCNLSQGIARLRGTAEGVQVVSLTLGNSSNEDYLLAGSTKNQAGGRFTVGKPRFVAAREEKP